MLYDIRATITYDYEAPVNKGRHALVVLPRLMPERQRIITARLSMDPEPAERFERTDFFGHTVTEVVFQKEHEQVAFSARARVEVFDAPRAIDISPDLSGLREDLSRLTLLDPDSPLHFCSPSPRIAQRPAFADYARSVITPGMSTQAVISTLGHALHSDMTFDPEATTAETDPDEAFANRRGVCQDYSHIMIGCLRGVGIPAAYVSGYIRTIPPKGQDRLEGADAMHAWVRAWGGSATGWVDFDPTNAMWATTDHIVVAMGRDYADVMPVRGILRTAGTQTSTQEVDVIPLEG